MTQTLLQSPSSLTIFFRLALATTTGCLWALGDPALPLSAVGWIAMIPLMILIDRTPSLRKVVLYCGWVGFLANVGGCYWLLETIKRFTSFSWLLSIALFLSVCAYQGLLFVLFGAAVHLVQHRKNVSMAVVAPLAIVAAELILPMVFPYSLAITQAWHPLLLQIADVTGPAGVSALLLLVNGAIYDILVGRRGAKRCAVIAGLIVLVCLGYGELRMRHFDTFTAAAPKLRVGIVQLNAGVTHPGVSSAQDAAQRLAALQEQSRELEAEGAQLIVWSEASYPYLLRRDAATDSSPGVLQKVMQGFTTPVVIGAQTLDAASKKRFNSAVLVGRTGAFAGIYDKIRLLNFGERVPAGEIFPWLTSLMPGEYSRFTPGTDARPLVFQREDGTQWRLGTFICFEDTLPEILRQVGRGHPHLLVNLTNDTWFGDTAEPWEHLALSVFDSIEERSALVRSVNSGLSAFIDVSGRVIQMTYATDPYFRPEPASHSLRSLPLIEGGHTLYSYVGDLFSYLCCLYLTVLIVSGYMPRFFARFLIRFKMRASTSELANA
jgi:apolipoprotein N-acyltransferase